jgi:hypothetical protein
MGLNAQGEAKISGFPRKIWQFCTDIFKNPETAHSAVAAVHCGRSARVRSG